MAFNAVCLKRMSSITDLFLKEGSLSGWWLSKLRGHFHCQIIPTIHTWLRADWRFERQLFEPITSAKFALPSPSNPRVADKATCDVLTLLFSPVLLEQGYTGDITTDEKACSNVLLAEKGNDQFSFPMTNAREQGILDQMAIIADDFYLFISLFLKENEMMREGKTVI